ncbi:MAG: hypothetical protein KIS29_11405 [Thermoplasmata archaeon]|nr:hypothetical protein [Candidatus Sysuiplasma jiujiangense]
MHIDSRDLIVSVNSSSYGDYKGKKANGCRITIAIQRLLKTLENPELESVFPVPSGSYTAPDIVMFGATKKNVLNFGTPDIEHENLHDSFCVCVQVMRVFPPQMKKSGFSENGYFQWFDRNGKKPSTCIDSRTCWNYQHELLSHAISMLSINQSINQSINHVTHANEVTA